MLCFRVLASSKTNITTVWGVQKLFSPTTVPQSMSLHPFVRCFIPSIMIAVIPSRLPWCIMPSYNTFTWQAVARIFHVTHHGEFKLRPLSPALHLTANVFLHFIVGLLRKTKNECALIFPVSALPSRRVCETAARAPSCWWTPRWFTQSRSPSTRPPSHWRPSRSPARSTWPSSPAYKHSRKFKFCSGTISTTQCVGGGGRGGRVKNEIISKEKKWILFRTHMRTH